MRIIRNKAYFSVTYTIEVRLKHLRGFSKLCYQYMADAVWDSEG